MHISELKDGQKLRCVSDYTNCIHAGKVYFVTEKENNNPEIGKEYFIQCDVGSHELLSTTDDNGKLPEFVIDV